jgi:hypothetical protein
MIRGQSTAKSIFSNTSNTSYNSMAQVKDYFIKRSLTNYSVHQGISYRTTGLNTVITKPFIGPCSEQVQSTSF